jgi:hypothetical protein
MKLIDNKTAFLLLLSQAASDSRKDILYGDSLEMVKKTVPDFLGNGPFPDIYLEFPLSGKPFLDISLTAVFDDTSETAYITSPLAKDTDRMMEYLRASYLKYPEVGGGFEIDTGSSVPTAAAVHFQPREHTELAGGFCEAVGEPQYAQLYEEMAGRLKDSWNPSYFGLFRGRSILPLRVGGYLVQNEIKCCIANPERIVNIFETVGFKAYDDQMIDQIVSVMSLTPMQNEFQFDIFPDGTIGDIFSLSTNFAIAPPDEAITALKEGDGARYFDLLKKWHIADSRIEKVKGSVFAKELPVGKMSITFSVFPQWFKVRWKAGNLQSAKGYVLIKAGEYEHAGLT